MTQIKSEIAEEYINIHYGFLTSKSAKNAVIIAETEAEERYAKQLQELKDKAVDAFIDNCPCRTPSGGCNFGNGNSPVCFKLECSDVYTFIQKLNEQ